MRLWPQAVELALKECRADLTAALGIADGLMEGRRVLVEGCLFPRQAKQRYG
jgi:hypothetical protein